MVARLTTTPGCPCRTEKDRRELAAIRRKLLATTVAALLPLVLTSCATMSARNSGLADTPVAQDAPPVDPRTLACAELKSRLSESGSLAVASAPRGGDVYHARIPRCEFWQRFEFSYVIAKDGWCGAGYICTAKLPP